MTSYHGDKTADIMNDMRRQTKKKQSRGTGQSRSTAQQEVDLKESRNWIPRHFHTQLHPDTKKALDMIAMSAMQDREQFSVTSMAFRDMAQGGIVQGDERIPLMVVIPDEPENAPHGGKTVTISNNGFLIDGQSANPDIWSITIMFAEYFGVRAKLDKETGRIFFS